MRYEFNYIPRKFHHSMRRSLNHQTNKDFNCWLGVFLTTYVYISFNGYGNIYLNANNMYIIHIFAIDKMNHVVCTMRKQFFICILNHMLTHVCMLTYACWSVNFSQPCIIHNVHVYGIYNILSFNLTEPRWRIVQFSRPSYPITSTGNHFLCRRENWPLYFAPAKY